MCVRLALWRSPRCGVPTRLLAGLSVLALGDGYFPNVLFSHFLFTFFVLFSFPSSVAPLILNPYLQPMAVDAYTRMLLHLSRYLFKLLASLFGIFLGTMSFSPPTPNLPTQPLT